MNLVDYITKNKGIQRGDKTHDSFVKFLSRKEVLESLGIHPPYHAIGFEVKVSKGGRRSCDLIVLNHELSIVEVKVIRSSTPKAETKRIKEMNNQLKGDYSYFNRKNIDTKIKLIGVYKNLDENYFNFYILPPSGLNVDHLEISQIPCL
jgi:hypothetical protein